MLECQRIYNQTMEANHNDALMGAHHLTDTMVKWPDTRTNDSIEALAALLREALAQRGR